MGSDGLVKLVQNFGWKWLKQRKLARPVSSKLAVKLGRYSPAETDQTATKIFNGPEPLPWSEPSMIEQLVPSCCRELTGRTNGRSEAAQGFDGLSSALNELNLRSDWTGLSHDVRSYSYYS